MRLYPTRSKGVEPFAGWERVAALGFMGSELCPLDIVQGAYMRMLNIDMTFLWNNNINYATDIDDLLEAQHLQACKWASSTPHLDVSHGFFSHYGSFCKVITLKHFEGFPPEQVTDSCTTCICILSLLYSSAFCPFV